MRKSTKTIVALKRATFKIDDVEYKSYDKVSVNAAAIHWHQIHYLKTTKCGLVVTKKIPITSSWKQVTCASCLLVMARKMRADLQHVESALEVGL